VHRKYTYIPIYVYIQQDTRLHSLFISGNCSTCIGWYLHPSLEAHTTVSTASGICHTVTAIWRYRGRVGTGLSVLWVAYDINKLCNVVSWWIYIGILLAHPVVHISRIRVKIFWSHQSWSECSVFCQQKGMSLKIRTNFILHFLFTTNVERIVSLKLRQNEMYLKTGR
jgi:hypothetical protein